MKNQAPKELKGIRAFLRQHRERIRELKRGLSPLQRLTLKRLWAIFWLFIIVNLPFDFAYENGYQPKTFITLFTLLLAFSIFAILIILGRYLGQETDEYIRMIVVKSLLWGAAVSAAEDAILSTVQVWSSEANLMPSLRMSLNIEFFVMGAVLSLAWQIRRHR
jgi:uncharacterized protein YhhL (DUF1145 family)